MTPSVRAWIVLALGVIGYDLAAPKGHTMSEQVDRWLVTHPRTTWAVGGIIFAHLLNITPGRFDVLHRATILVKGQ